MLEIVEDLLTLGGACSGYVLLYKCFYYRVRLVLADLCAFDKLLVEALVEVVVLVEDIRYAARHTRGKVVAGFAENNDRTARHVLAAVVAYALNDRCRA